MLATSSDRIPTIIHQHIEESAILRNVRSVLLAAPHLKLHHLGRLDDRLAAHLDSLAVAGEFGWKLCESALEKLGVGEVFATTVRAIEDGNSLGLDKLLALVEAAPESLPGLISAFGWVSAQHLQGTIKNLLASDSVFQHQVGIAACAMHRVDPGAALDAALADADPSLRARGLRVAGQCGRRDLLAACVKALADEDAACRFWAARSAALLGERGKALDILKSIALQAGPAQARSLALVLKLIDAGQANALLKVVAQDASHIRYLIQGAGMAGDSHYVPWLIKQMEESMLCRLAGESFTFITGLDLAYLDLERKPPENVESGPNDDPNDDNVAMDEDDSLPWPDRVKIQAWWDVNQQRFQPGVRYFMGERLSVQHCKKVLREGYLRQRIAAAEYLCLLQPGTQLFPTSAPAWRQQRWLNQMG
ncbi:MAG: hypothetical protein JWR07_3208 [Nevskia sp.]|nr:hypothetical protein [Nevskia sp.]